jgi:hypothetical protein
MNWPEFVAACEEEMRRENVNPDDVTMRVEVSDGYYDGNLTPMRIVIMEYYDKPHLVLWGN